MINIGNVQQVLTDKAVAVCAAVGITFYTRDETIPLSASNTNHVVGGTIYGRTNEIGINETDLQINIYQLDVKVPKTENEFVLSDLVDAITAYYQRPLELSASPQKIRIRSTSVTSMRQDDNYLMMYISVTFHVIA